MPRRSKRVADAVDEMVKMGHDPIQALVKLARDPDIPVSERARINMELARYWAPQKKAVEVKQNDMVHKVEVTWRGPKPQG